LGVGIFSRSSRPWRSSAAGVFPGPGSADPPAARAGTDVSRQAPRTVAQNDGRKNTGERRSGFHLTGSGPRTPRPRSGPPTTPNRSRSRGHPGRQE
jgi:hypothetical protein